MVGIILNLLLFAGKFIAGKISGSVSITADAFNNLMDAGTVCMTALGIKIAALGPGQKHPKGHGKFEWIVALVTSMSVILVGWELLQNSWKSLNNPTNTIFSLWTLVILIISIAIKIFLYIYNSNKSKLSGLISLKSVAIDSLSDAISTTAVLFSLLLNYWFGWKLDGWFGMAVSLLILYNSIKACSETVERIMGVAAPKEDIKRIEDIIQEVCREKVRIYNILIEDYGYGRKRASFYIVPVNATDVMNVIRDVPALTKRLKEELEYESMIQVEEPVSQEKQDELFNHVQHVIQREGYECVIEDFRVVNMQENHIQMRMSVRSLWFEKEKIEMLEKFFQNPNNLGLKKEDSILIDIKLGILNREDGRNIHRMREKRSR